MTEEDTQPPHQPNTFRTWLPRLWRAAVKGVADYPDVAIITFIALLIVAVLL